jgi:hypothetical protein
VSKETFDALKAVLVAHSKGLRVTKDEATHFQLHTAGPVEFEGRKLPNIYFAWLKEGKHDTALHFFPIYSHPQRFADLPPNLRKKLTGKACFHIKTVDSDLLESVGGMLERGREIYGIKSKV